MQYSNCVREGGQLGRSPLAKEFIPSPKLQPRKHVKVYIFLPLTFKRMAEQFQ